MGISGKFQDTFQLELGPLSDEGRKLLLDSGFIRDQKVVANGPVTHSGVLINYPPKLYRPSRLKGSFDKQTGFHSLIAPRFCPVVERHDTMDSEAVGTIRKATFVDTSNGRGDDFVASQWDGPSEKLATGRIEATQHIEEPGVIKRIVDRRLNRQSVWIETDHLRDSISGFDLKSDEKLPDYYAKGFPKTVEGKPLYLIPDQMRFLHLAFTDNPADRSAGIEDFSIQLADSDRPSRPVPHLLTLFAFDQENKRYLDMADEDPIGRKTSPSFPVQGLRDEKKESPVTLEELKAEIEKNLDAVLAMDPVKAKIEARIKEATEPIAGQLSDTVSERDAEKARAEKAEADFAGASKRVKDSLVDRALELRIAVGLTESDKAKADEARKILDARSPESLEHTIQDLTEQKQALDRQGGREPMDKTSSPAGEAGKAGKSSWWKQ